MLEAHIEPNKHDENEYKITILLGKDEYIEYAPDKSTATKTLADMITELKL